MSRIETILDTEKVVIKSLIKSKTPFIYIEYLKHEYNLRTSINKLNNIALDQYNFYKEHKIQGDLIYLSLAHLTRIVVTAYDKNFEMKKLSKK